MPFQTIYKAFGWYKETGGIENRPERRRKTKVVTPKNIKIRFVVGFISILCSPCNKWLKAFYDALVGNQRHGEEATSSCRLQDQNQSRFLSIKRLVEDWIYQHFRNNEWTELKQWQCAKIWFQRFGWNNLAIKFVRSQSNWLFNLINSIKHALP